LAELQIVVILLSVTNVLHVDKQLLSTVQKAESYSHL